MSRAEGEALIVAFGDWTRAVDYGGQMKLHLGKSTYNDMCTDMDDMRGVREALWE